LLSQLRQRIDHFIDHEYWDGEPSFAYLKFDVDVCFAASTSDPFN